jgi:transposase-like protein
VRQTSNRGMAHDPRKRERLIALVETQRLEVKRAAEIVGVPRRTATRWLTGYRESIRLEAEARRKRDQALGVASRAAAQPAVGSAPSSPEGGAFNDGVPPTADGGLAQEAIPAISGLGVYGAPHRQRRSLDALMREAIRGAA